MEENCLLEDTLFLVCSYLLVGPLSRILVQNLEQKLAKCTALATAETA